MHQTSLEDYPMGAIRLPLLLLVLFIMSAGCSKSDNNKPAAGRAMFAGCPVTSNGNEDFTGGRSAIPKAIFSNNPNRVYSVGVVTTPKSTNADPSANSVSVPDQAIVRLSVDGGNVFSTFDQSTGPKGEGAENDAITADSSNVNIYVAQTYKNGSAKSANIHYTKDGGWKDAQFQLNGQNDEYLTGAALSQSGKPVFTGVSEDASHKKTGFIISLDVDKNKTDLVTSLENADFKKIASEGPNLLVVGTNYGKDPVKDPTSWLLGRWVDSDQKFVNLSEAFPNILDAPSDETFLNLKKFSVTYPELAPIYTAAVVTAKARAATKSKESPTPVLTPLSGGANAILITPDNFIFVAGTVKALDENEPDIWVVRKSANSAASFTTSDIFNDGAFKTLVPNSLVDYENHVLAIGGSRKKSTDPKNSVPSDSHWHVRGAQDRLSNWVTLSSPKFSSDPNEVVQAVGGVITGTGDKKYLIVLGDTHEKGGIHHWRTQVTTSCVRPH
jgi:hypothetical protein